MKPCARFEFWSVIIIGANDAALSLSISDVPLIRPYPVGGDLVLRLLQRHAAAANRAPKVDLKLVLSRGISGGACPTIPAIG
jgi:hypothetical protein